MHNLQALEEHRVIKVLHQNSDRDAYQANCDSWYTSHGGGEIDARHVCDLFNKGGLSTRWADVPVKDNFFVLDDAYPKASIAGK